MLELTKDQVIAIRVILGYPKDLSVKLSDDNGMYEKIFQFVNCYFIELFGDDGIDLRMYYKDGKTDIPKYRQYKKALDNAVDQVIFGDTAAYTAIFATKDETFKKKFSDYEEAKDWLLELEATNCDEWVVENKIV